MCAAFFLWTAFRSIKTVQIKIERSQQNASDVKFSSLDLLFLYMYTCKEAGQDNKAKYDAKHLVCSNCVSGKDKKTCRIHGTEFM